MRQQAFWKRLDIPGHDTALLIETADGGHVLSGATVFHDGRPVWIAYRVDLAPDWSTRSGLIRGFVGGDAFMCDISRDDDMWSVNGVEQPELSHLADLDLGFTPSTNLQQLKRMPLEIGEETDLPAAWLDVGAERLVELPQHYRRIDETRYGYASRDFETTLVLAPSGFAEAYPPLWEMEGMK